MKRWQNWYSEDSLASRRQRSRGKVRRFLNYLETIQQIEQHKSKVKSTITIINYDKYQWNDTTDSTTDGQQTDTIKKYKKEKEVKESIIDFESTLLEFQKMRKNIKKPMTENAVKLLRNELEKLAPWDDNIKIAIMNKSIMNCWLWVFPLKEDEKNSLIDPVIQEYEKQTQVCFEKWWSDDTENQKLMEKRKQLESKYWNEKAMDIRKNIKAKYR